MTHNETPIYIGNDGIAYYRRYRSYAPHAYLVCYLPCPGCGEPYSVEYGKAVHDCFTCVLARLHKADKAKRRAHIHAHGVKRVYADRG